MIDDDDGIAAPATNNKIAAQDKAAAENAYTIETLLNLPSDTYLELDARGLLCPEPVMLLHKRVSVASAGGIIKVRATDDSTLRDIPRFCEFLRHSLLNSMTLTGGDNDEGGQGSVKKNPGREDHCQKPEYVFWIQKRIE